MFSIVRSFIGAVKAFSLGAAILGCECGGGGMRGGVDVDDCGD